MKTPTNSQTVPGGLYAVGARIGRARQFFRILGIVSVVAGAAYLIWRAVATHVGAHPVLFVVLLAAESIGWLSFALFVRDAWLRDPLPHIEGPRNRPVDIAIPTFNEPRDVLEPTLIGATRVKGNTTVWVLDDGERPWVKELAESLGINYVTRTNHDGAKAGNINNALHRFRGEFLLLLDADHVALPTIVNQLIGYFGDGRVAVVQSPHGFRNLDSAQHYRRTVNEQSLFFDVLMPGRGRTDAVFWCGSGAMLRLDALRSIGGIATSTITEDLETSLELHKRGWKLVYHNEVLLNGLAPHNLAAFLIQRYRWARGTLQILLGRLSPIFGRGFAMKTRLSYLSNLIYYLVPLQHLAFVLVISVALLTGALPANFADPLLVGLWALQLGLTLIVIWGMSEGRQVPFTGSRNAWITGSVYIRALLDALFGAKASFAVTPKVGIDVGGWESFRLLWLPVATTTILMGSIATRTVDIALPEVQLLPELSNVASAVLAFFAFTELIVLVPLIANLVRRHQYRAVWRFQTDLRGEVAGFPCRIVDLHESGVGLVVNHPLFGEYADERELSLGIVVPIVDDTTTIVRGTVSTVRPASRQKDGTWKASGHVRWNSDLDRQRVMEYCYVAAARTGATS